MKDSYLSGVTHPSEVFEKYNELDQFDKERFIKMLLEDYQSREIFYDLCPERYYYDEY